MKRGYAQSAAPDSLFGSFFGSGKSPGPNESSGKKRAGPAREKIDAGADAHANDDPSEVKNFYEALPQKDPNDGNPNFAVHGIKIPFRMTIVGASGSMKTNSALDILSKFRGTFYHVTLVCRCADEPLYKMLQEKLGEDQLEVIEVAGDDISALPSVEDTDKEKPSLVIFDDLVLLKNQRKISEFFIRARKFGRSCMYLTQSYFGCPKVIRGNCDYIILKKIASMRDLNLILREYQLGVSQEELIRLYEECTREKLDWFMISIYNEANKRFLKNYEAIETSAGKSDLGSNSRGRSETGRGGPPALPPPRPGRETNQDEANARHSRATHEQWDESFFSKFR